MAEGRDGKRWLLPPMIFARLLQNLDLRARPTTPSSWRARSANEAAIMRRLGATVTVLESDGSHSPRTDPGDARRGRRKGLGSGSWSARSTAAGRTRRRSTSSTSTARWQTAAAGAAGAAAGGRAPGCDRRRRQPHQPRPRLFVRSGETFGSRAIFDAGPRRCCRRSARSRASSSDHRVRSGFVPPIDVFRRESWFWGNGRRRNARDAGLRHCRAPPSPYSAPKRNSLSFRVAVLW